MHIYAILSMSVVAVLLLNILEATYVAQKAMMTCYHQYCTKSLALCFYSIFFLNCIQTCLFYCGT